MNLRTFAITRAALTSFCVIGHTAQAIETPADDAPPPAAAIEPQPAAPAPATQPSAFLGLISQPLPDVLREHLGLAQDSGVLVRSVIPDGPAAKAGIAANDVITCIDGKQIRTPEELTRAISARKPGEQIKLSTVHHGKPAEWVATLAERPANMPMAGAPNANQPGQEALDHLGIPDEFAERIRRMLEENAGGVEFPFLQEGQAAPGAGADPAIDDLRKRIGEMRKRADDLRKQAEGGIPLPPGGAGGNFQLHQGATFRMMDEKGTIEMKSDNGSKEVTVKDSDHKIIWNGPWDTPQDKAAAPPEVRERIERLNIQDGGGFRLQLQPMPGR